MQDWSDSIHTQVKRDGAAVVITVIAVDGSVPREIGATLIVSSGGNSGTIGGGNLEYTCVKEAHKLLSDADVRSIGAVRTCRQLSLGPSLGQCCGGRVELLLEVVTAKTQWYRQLTAGHDVNTARWLCRSIEGSNAFVATAEELQQSLVLSDEGAIPASGLAVSDAHNTRYFYQSLVTDHPAIWIYGAGHVGQAVVSQLTLLSWRVTLLDHREEWLHLQPNQNIGRILTDAPADESAQASADTAHVVMTHSHAVDFEICHALLKRTEFSWLGLIGSDTKRQTFNNRLSQRGLSDELISQLRCPIGSLSLTSSVPSAIALNLAAELAHHFELAGKLRQTPNNSGF